MWVHPKGTYAHLTENSQDFIFLLLSKNFSVCLLGAHTKKLSQWELDTLCMFIISWSQPYTWSVQKVIPSLIKRCKGIYRLFLSFHIYIYIKTIIQDVNEILFSLCLSPSGTKKFWLKILCFFFNFFSIFFSNFAPIFFSKVFPF